VKNEEALHSVKEDGASYIQQNAAIFTQLITSCIGTALKEVLMRYRHKKEKARKKRHETTGCLQQKEKTLKFETRSIQSYSLKNSLP
jgi:ABC-type lipopolysaccharide export system ATPase subunit